MTTTNYLRAYVDRAAMQSEMGTPIRFVAATEGIKRDGLNLKMAGARLEHYRRNSVFLWCHDYYSRPPIGRTNTFVEGDRLISDVTFDQADEYARAIERKYREGFLNAVSIGWNIEELNGRDVEAWELLDVSAVPVPGDPLALKEQRNRVIQQLTSELESLLDAPEGGDKEPVDSWTEAARRMVRVFLEPAGDEAARKAEWAAVSKSYRRLGKVAPEWMAEAVLSALDDEGIRGLFLEDEATVCADEFARKRAGAVLSKANLEDLQQAVTLIQGVIARAAKETPAEERAAADPVVTVDDEQTPAPAPAVDLGPLMALRAMLSEVVT